MASLKKVFASLLGGGSDANTRFAELRRIRLALGFSERVTGGHHIFHRQDVAEIQKLTAVAGWQGEDLPDQAGPPSHCQIPSGAAGVTR